MEESFEGGQEFHAPQELNPYQIKRACELADSVENYLHVLWSEDRAHVNLKQLELILTGLTTGNDAFDKLVCKEAKKAWRHLVVQTGEKVVLPGPTVRL